jgi:hypothetical protein
VEIEYKLIDIHQYIHYNVLNEIRVCKKRTLATYSSTLSLQQWKFCCCFWFLMHENTVKEAYAIHSYSVGV